MFHFDDARILVAEDDRMTATILRFALERAGCDVVVAHDGASAVAAAEERRFDLVLVDHRMPRGNGSDVCRALRDDPRHADVPIVFCTGKGLELDLDELQREFGVRAVFFKPFSMTELLGCIEAALGDPHATTCCQ